MAQKIGVTFLGTSSGGGPSDSRNCSSLVMDICNNGTLWMVDCAEGTLRQFSLQPRTEIALKPINVSKVFITHMHADHTMGLITFLRNILRPKPTPSDPPSNPHETNLYFQPRTLEIWGPRGIRQFVRTILRLTHSRAHPDDAFVVHELLERKEEPSASAKGCKGDELVENELVGRDFWADRDGLWRDLLRVELGKSGKFGEVVVDAGPIAHRDPCLGYVFTAKPPAVRPHPAAPLYAGRKVVILGDTSDPYAIRSLCRSPPPDLLVHEATEAYIPSSVDPKSKRSREVVEEKCEARGHSTPLMAGAFARAIGARRLVLNHIGARFPAPTESYRPKWRVDILEEMERQASDAWGVPGARVALDFMRVVIPPMKVEEGGEYERRRPREEENNGRNREARRREVKSRDEEREVQGSRREDPRGPSERLRGGDEREDGRERLSRSYKRPKSDYR